MTTVAPAGYLWVRGDSPTQHLTEFSVGALAAPALCGARPVALWDAATHDYTGPPRWSQAGRHGTGGNPCPCCAEEVSRVTTG